MARTKEERIADRAKAREAAGRELSRRQQKSTGATPTPSPSPAPSAPPKPKVAEVRAAAKSSGQSLRDYKAANNITPKYTSEERRSTATQTKGDITKYDASSVGAKNQKYSHNDIKALRDQGYSNQSIGKHLQSLGEDGNLGGAAKRLRDKYVNSLTPTPTPEPTPAPTPEPTPVQPPRPTPTPSPSPTPIAPITTPTVPGVGPGIIQNPDNSQEQDVTQDNDINTNIDGNNNTVVNNQDNSVRQYGGDNRSFIYNGGGSGSGV